MDRCGRMVLSQCKQMLPPPPPPLRYCSHYVLIPISSIPMPTNGGTISVSHPTNHHNLPLPTHSCRLCRRRSLNPAADLAGAQTARDRSWPDSVNDHLIFFRNTAEERARKRKKRIHRWEGAHTEAGGSLFFFHSNGSTATTTTTHSCAGINIPLLTSPLPVVIPDRRVDCVAVSSVSWLAF